MVDLIGALLMVKDEENSIATTINSVKDYIKHIIVYDTGSTDNTISIIRQTCEANGQFLHLKQGHFVDFPTSRNVGLDFAESAPVKYLLMLDAGDEFKCEHDKTELQNIIQKFPLNIGQVRQQWGVEQHFDIRFVKNKCGIRYLLDYPVHEQMDIRNEQIGNMGNLFFLFQCRKTHGASTEKRYNKDIEMLRKARPCKRNLFYLAQSYMSIDDYANGFKYNLLTVQSNDGDGHGDDSTNYSRAGYCAIQCKYPEKVIISNLLMSIKICEDPVIDSYIYLLKYFIDTNQAEKAIPYIDAVRNMKMVESNKTTNFEFYNYYRWKYIGLACLMSKIELEKGRDAYKRILHYNEQEDLHNYKLFPQQGEPTVEGTYG